MFYVDVFALFLCCFSNFSYFCNRIEVALYTEGVEKSILPIILLISSIFRPSFWAVFFVCIGFVGCELVSN